MDIFDREVQLCRNSEKVIFFVAEAVCVMVRAGVFEPDFLALYLGSATLLRAFGQVTSSLCASVFSDVKLK